MTWHRTITGAFFAAALLGSSQAHAHIKLLKPASFLKEDELGGPQKGSPCGPGNKRPFVGDDVQPVPYNDEVTTFHAGETITVEWQETIYHAGYFRIAFAPVAAKDATTDDFPDPALSDPEQCLFDRSAVKTEPHDNVLADGLHMADAKNGEVRHFSEQVKLPDEPCDNCTLQVVQVMEAHPAASCFYFHCANIKLLPKDHASAPVAGSHSAADAGSTAKPAAQSESGGCAVFGTRDHGDAAAIWVFGVGMWLRLRSRRKPTL